MVITRVTNINGGSVVEIFDAYTGQPVRVIRIYGNGEFEDLFEESDYEFKIVGLRGDS